MQRKKYDAKFKAKVALEIAKGLHTVNEIATQYNVHPNMITKWKRDLLEGMPGIFSRDKKRLLKEQQNEELMASLYQKIGKLEVELDWLKKKSELIH